MPTLAGLEPHFRPLAERFYAFARALGAPVVVTSARRSWQEQAALWKRYTSGQSSLTALPPGKSMHQYGLAFDMATPNVDPKEDPWLVELGRRWQADGGIWGGEADPVHFQAPHYISDFWPRKHNLRRRRRR